MKKIVKALGIAAIALALFANLNTNSESTEVSDVLAFNIANAAVETGSVKCRQTDVKTDYCVSGGFKFYCANTTATDNCTGKPDDAIVAMY